MRQRDPKWEECKKLVDRRDKRQCQFIRCLSITEFNQIVGSGLKCIDRCHILPRSVYPKLIYNKNNIISLQRFIHQRMDNYLNPITGENIDNHYHFYWWWRIVTHTIEKYDENFNYEEELKKIIGVII